MFLITSNHRSVPVTHARRGALEDDLRDHLRAGTGFRMATVNLDHMVQITQNDAFARAYAQQDIIVADGRPIRWLSQLAGAPVDLMPGSDMIVPLARLATEEDRAIAMIGSTEKALSEAEAHLRRLIPALRVAYRHATAMGFDPDGVGAGPAERS